VEEFAGYFATDDQLWKFSRHLKERTFIHGLEIAAHTRSCFNVRYRTEPNTKKVEREKLKIKNGYAQKYRLTVWGIYTCASFADTSLFTILQLRDHASRNYTDTVRF